LFDLDDPVQEFLGWEWFLSEDEIERSKRYRFEQDRRCFVARRGILRQLLGRYTGLVPAEIAYHLNPYGKLSLSSHPLQFNLSTCQNRFVIAFILEKPVGVDLELVHSFTELDRMAERWFSPVEQAGLSYLVPEFQMDAFFHIWTQKEAFIKAHGEGLSLPLQDFSVSVDPNLPGGLLSIRTGAEDVSAWKIYTHMPVAGWRVAVCVRADAEVEIRWNMTELADFVR